MKLLAALAVLSPLSTSAAPSYFDEDHREQINGTTLHYRVRGWDRNNPYLLILHGGPGSSALEFLPWGTLLEKKLNVVYLDQRGSGLSARVTFKTPGKPTAEEARGFTFEDAVRDIEGVREKLGVDRWFVLGHSFGGMVGVEYVTAYSEHVRGYIHMNGLLSMPMINRDWLDYAERAVTKTAKTATGEEKVRVGEVLRNVRALRAAPPDELNRKIGPMVISKITPERIRDRYQASNVYDGRIDAEVLAKYKITPDALGAPEPGASLDYNEGLAEREVLPLLGDIHSPTLIITAASDPIIPPKRARLMHSQVAGSRLVLIRDAGHEVYKDQPAETAAAILRFTQSVRSPQSLVACRAR